MLENNKQEEAILAEFVRFMMHYSAGNDIDESLEKEADFDNLMKKSRKSIEKLLPDLDRQEVDMILQNLEEKIIPLLGSPDIPDKYRDLVEKAHERYLAYQLNTRNNLDNLLGSISSLLFFCVLYLFSLPIA